MHYFISLPNDLEIHTILNVSHLKELLGFDNNTVTTKTFVTFEDLASKPHVPKKILDVKTKHLHSKNIREFKIKWMDKSIKDYTWE